MKCIPREEVLPGLEYGARSLINRTGSGYEFLLKRENDYRVRSGKVDFLLPWRASIFSSNGRLYFYEVDLGVAWLNNGEVETLEPGVFNPARRPTYTLCHFFHSSGEDAVCLENQQTGGTWHKLSPSGSNKFPDMYVKGVRNVFQLDNGDCWDGQVVAAGRRWDSTPRNFFRSVGRLGVPDSDSDGMEDLGTKGLEVRFLDKDKAVFVFNCLGKIYAECHQVSAMFRIWGVPFEGTFKKLLPVDKDRVLILIEGGLVIIENGGFRQLNIDGDVIDVCVSSDGLVASVLTDAGVWEVDLW